MIHNTIESTNNYSRIRRYKRGILGRKLISDCMIINAVKGEPPLPAEPLNEFYAYGDHYIEYPSGQLRGHHSVTRYRSIPYPDSDHGWNWDPDRGGVTYTVTYISGSGIYDNSLFPDYDPIENQPRRGYIGAVYTSSQIEGWKMARNDVTAIKKFIEDWNLPSYILDLYKSIRQQGFNSAASGQNPHMDPEHVQLDTWGKSASIKCLVKYIEGVRTFSFFID